MGWLGETSRTDRRWTGEPSRTGARGDKSVKIVVSMRREDEDAEAPDLGCTMLALCRTARGLPGGEDAREIQAGEKSGKNVQGKVRYRFIGQEDRGRSRRGETELSCESRRGPIHVVLEAPRTRG